TRILGRLASIALDATEDLRRIDEYQPHSALVAAVRDIDGVAIHDVRHDAGDQPWRNACGRRCRCWGRLTLGHGARPGTKTRYCPCWASASTSPVRAAVTSSSAAAISAKAIRFTVFDHTGLEVISRGSPPTASGVVARGLRHSCRALPSPTIFTLLGR